MSFEPGYCELCKIHRINPQRVLVFPKYLPPVIHKMQIFRARKHGLRDSLCAIHFNRNIHRVTQSATSELARNSRTPAFLIP